MSAYLVHTDTIDYLVAAAGKFGASFYLPALLEDAAEIAARSMQFSSNNVRWDGRSDYQSIGAVLLAQNVLSVNYRYDETTPIPEYVYRSIPYSEIDPVLVLKSIACLRYQSCETPDYLSTTAAYVLDVIEKEAIAHLPGYDDAPWGWTREQVTRGVGR